MRPKKMERDRSDDLFRARLDQIIDMGHELVRLADEIDWDWLGGARGTIGRSIHSFELGRREGAAVHFSIGQGGASGTCTHG